MSRKLILPEWATVIAPGRIEVHPDQYMNEYFDELAGQTFPSELLNDLRTPFFKKDQCWATIATIFMRIDIERAIAGTKAAPINNGALIILIQNEEAGRMDNYPKGSGEEAGRVIASKLYNAIR